MHVDPWLHGHMHLDTWPFVRGYGHGFVHINTRPSAHGYMAMFTWILAPMPVDTWLVQKDAYRL
jgi:hypothetical protein